MDKIFCVYTHNGDTLDGAEAFLNLPATPYEMLDALDKLRLAEGSRAKFRINDYYRFGLLAPLLSESYGLHELNTLAQKLSELDDEQAAVFEKLLITDCKTRKPSLPNLIDLACSASCGHAAPAGWKLPPKRPDYTILLETETGFQCKLPSAVLPKVRYVCLDCRAPALTNLISQTEDIHAVNHVAQRLANMSTPVLNGYKALLEAVKCPNLGAAITLADSLDEYILSPQFSSPVEVAKGELSVILAEQIAPHLDLYQYGKALIQKCGGVLTEYGLIERKDQATVEQPQRGGMEMI